MHTFTAFVKEKTRNRIVVSQPEGVYKSLKRKHERIRPPSQVKASFTLQGKNFELNFPKTSRYFNVEKPEASQSFDDSSVQGLIKDFRGKIKKMNLKDEIVILRNKMPVTFEENLMYKTAKIIWLPSLKDGYAIADPFPDGRILTKREIIQLDFESEFSDKILTSRLENQLEEKKREGIQSEIYCPILYNQFFIGYVHVYSVVEKREPIGEAIIEYVFQFTKVLCYSLEIHGYFTALANQEKNFETQIIDMSASGLLFTHPMHDLSKDLLLHTDIRLNLQFAVRRMDIGARIIRKFKDKDHLYIGLQFLEVAPEDFRYLFETLYGKPYKKEYDDRWEGGIPPPELVFD
jgi:hypothetical protein